ncbi:MAG: precorrin-8X methylmutase [Magnetospiraceae bacterium]
MTRFEYCRDPAEIYRQSFAAIRAACDLTAIPADLQPLALRIVHACGDPDILNHLRWSAGAGQAGATALQRGAPILCDANMVAAGITRRFLPTQNPVICTLDQARAKGSTRAAAAVDLWQAQLTGAVVAIGNAPTALFRLLELLAAGAPPPALIIGLPVGFIGAAESKQALADHAGDTPFVTLLGRRGGSAYAAAAVNALCLGTAE